MNNLGRNTKKYRLHKGLTQQMLAFRAGVTRGYISLLESGKKEPTISTLYKIADVLGVEVSKFFEGDPNSLDFLLIKSGELNTPPKSNPSSISSYKFLAATIRNKMIDPFLLRVDPGEQKVNREYAHIGEEFSLVLKGRIKFTYGDKEFILEKGDAAYFNSSVVHNVKALNQKPALLLCVTTNRQGMERTW
jgi:transcriptional regulator with XRE-family HTH domain